MKKTISIAAAATFALAAVPALAQAGPPAPGAPLGNEFEVAGAQDQPAVAMDANGDFVAVSTGSYGTNHEYSNVYGQRYDAAGTPLGSQFQINVPEESSVAADPAVAMDADGDFVVVWDGRGIFAQRYDADGTPLGSVFQVNAPTSDVLLFPAVAMDAAGGFVVAWDGNDGDGQGIIARGYDANGAPLGSQFQVNTQISGQQTSPEVSMDADGDFVVAWVDLGTSDDDWDIFARHYAVDGTPAGAFRVNTYTSGRQLFPAVAMDAAGGFVVAWTDQSGEDGDSWGVFAQHYAADSTPLGSEFQVNTRTEGDQDAPAVAMDASGDFAVAWTDDSNDQDIFARRYAADGTALDSAFRVNNHTAYSQVAAAVAMDAAGGFVVAWEGPDGVFAHRYAGTAPLDLEGTLAVAPDAVKAGGAITLTAGINNLATPVTPTGNASIDKALTAATALTATLTFPSGFTLRNAMGTHWNCPAALTGQKLTCTYDAPLAAASTTPALTINVTTHDSGDGKLTFTSAVFGAQPDANSDNNTATASVAVEKSAGNKDGDTGGGGSGGGGGALGWLGLGLLGLAARPRRRRRL